ncbi:MAG: serine--tRNA ligase [Deltaproteobacteria bacterium]|nr:serine--tRNA ligase [Deltaproteobacteria bacterium]
MLDIKFARENPEKVIKALEKRHYDISVFDDFLKNEKERKTILSAVENHRQKLNEISNKVGVGRKQGQDVSELLFKAKELSDTIKNQEAFLSEWEEKVKNALLIIPNIQHATVPEGKTPDDNREVRRYGNLHQIAFTPRDHSEIGVNLGILDFERGSKIAGARFTLYKGLGALLERALINFMLDVHTRENGYIEVLPPFMVNRACMTGTGQLPKFEDDLFKIEGWDHFLIPTAEVPVTNIFRDEILKEGELPIYYTAYTPCFRKEAGSYGKDVKGLIRQHQFNKVELVKFAKPETSYDELEKLTSDAEKILQKLGLHYRVVELCAGDIGFSSAKTYDIEVWLPGQGKYREISSCSNFEDFQARRANIKYKPKDGGKPRFVHTLNGSGLAVGRTLVAILENFQQEDGSVIIPEALRPYMGGVERIVSGKQ